MAGGGELLADYRGLSVTGLVEAIRVLPKSLSTFNRLVEAARTEKPNALVLIDFPDFNFRSRRRAVKKLGVPIIYYISPQLWAWRRSRMKVMKRLVDRVLVIFPFEEQIYRDAGVPVQFVGHPLVDLARAQEPKDSVSARDRSRSGAADRRAAARQPSERSRAAAAGHARRRREDRGATARRAVRHRAGALARRSPVLEDDVERVRPVEVLARTDDVLAVSDVAMTASGTATVQAALHGRPMVVVYRLSPLTYRLGRRFLLVDMSRWSI